MQTKAQGSSTEKINETFNNNNIDRCISSWKKELKKKNTSNSEVSVASVAIQYNTTHDGSEGTVFFYYIRHFRDYPLPDKHKTSSFMNTGFFKKQQLNKS